MRLLHGLLLAGLLFQSAQQVQVSNDPRAYYGDELFQRVGKSFSNTRCTTRKATVKTIHDILVPDLVAVRIHYYASAWHDFVPVRDYIQRLFDATPEGDKVSANIYWSEDSVAEIIASLEFKNGQRTKILLGNGYAHFVDASGCEWWARYLGGDKSKWIVRGN
jgi:hypothetical protein